MTQVYIAGILKSRQIYACINIILYLPFLGESWSLSIGRYICRLKVVERRALRGIYGPKMLTITDGGKKFHNNYLHNFYFSPDTTRETNQEGEFVYHMHHMGLPFPNTG
jgi:hypothetical protein